MLALYRCGRQADALGAYRAGRRRLSDEFGLEPMPELRELEQRILRHDPALAASVFSTGAGSVPPPGVVRVGASPRGRLVLGAAAAAVRHLARPRVVGSSGSRLAARTRWCSSDADGRLGTQLYRSGWLAETRDTGGGAIWTSNERDGTRLSRRRGRDGPSRRSRSGAAPRHSPSRAATSGSPRRRRAGRGDRPARAKGRAHAPRRQRADRAGRTRDPSSGSRTASTAR